MSRSSNNCIRCARRFTLRSYERSLEELGRSQRQRLDANLTSEEARYEAGTVDRGALAAATFAGTGTRSANRGCASGLRRRASSNWRRRWATISAPGAALPSPQGRLDFQPVNFPLESETAAALERRADLRSGAPSRPRRARRSTHRRGRFLSAPRSHDFSADTSREQIQLASRVRTAADRLISFLLKSSPAPATPGA